MAVESIEDLVNQPFIREGKANMDTGTFKTNGSRSGAVVAFTLLSIDTATGYWTTFTDETATDGTQIPQGISFRAITEAAIKAGNVGDYQVYRGGDFTFDQNQLTIENAKTLATVITVPTNLKLRVRDWLQKAGMTPVDVVDIDAYENA